MAKGELKTKKNRASVSAFINAVDDDQKRKDAKVILKIMREITGKKPVMWGTSIIGFDQYHYKSERSSQEGDWPIIGFSPRKQNLTIYIMPGYQDFGPLLNDLGKHSTGKSCLYIKKLEDIHLPILKKIIIKGYKDMLKLQKG